MAIFSGIFAGYSRSDIGRKFWGWRGFDGLRMGMGTLLFGELRCIFLRDQKLFYQGG